SSGRRSSPAAWLRQLCACPDQLASQLNIQFKSPAMAATVVGLLVYAPGKAHKTQVKGVYTMTRLTSIEKGGYYAFPDEHLPAVASLFAPARSGGKLLDPCAGEGRALDALSRAWNLTAYANELDTERAAACK